jgi:hypothetical protein
MQLTPSSEVDIDKRFREELRQQQLNASISLEGNEMLIAVAEALLHKHAPHITFAQHGAPVKLMTMERFGSAFITAFLEEQEPPQGQMLLYSVPEQEIILFAKHHEIPIVEEEKDDAQLMLDDLAKSQPQTYQSLMRSALRLLPQMHPLRRSK